MNVKTARKSRLYSTAWAKQRGLVAHLSVSADCADPVADLYEDLQKLTEGQYSGVKSPLWRAGFCDTAETLLCKKRGLSASMMSR